MIKLDYLLNLIKEDNIESLHLILCNGLEDTSSDILGKCLQESAREKREKIFYLLSVSWIIQISRNLCDEDPFIPHSPDNQPAYLSEFAEQLINNFQERLFFFYRIVQKTLMTKEPNSSNISQELLKSLLKDAIHDKNSDNLENSFGNEQLILILFKNVVKRNDRGCLEIMINSKRVVYIAEIFPIILKSDLEDKFDIFKRMTDIQQFKHINVLAILRNAIYRQVKIDVLKKILPLYRFSAPEKRVELCNAMLLNSSLDLFLYGVGLNLYEFTEESAIFSIKTPNLPYLKGLMYKFTNVYKTALEKLPFTISFRVTYGLISPQHLGVICSHPLFQDDRRYLNMFFLIFFKPRNFFNLAIYSSSRLIALLEAFWIELENSSDLLGLSQEVLNSAVLCLLKDFSCPNAITYSRIISVFLQNGYLLNGFSIPKEYLDRNNEKSKIQQSLLNLLLESADQRQYNEFMLKSDGINTIMSLKSMTRWLLRNLIKRPFKVNLKRMIKSRHLPFSLESIIALEKEANCFESLVSQN
ncbi:unnamed protein product [Dimorphilus gyrociliatus]|uniref:Uncharacterized protein n=1 Tax=Dimorphilus gyrociliatus TaxID=2664684 RepID=A0A7I8VLF0_9ANNE|nr:unnamed protein product [Dimorphilus gyrociliatus]